jgi:hypothetical protein
MTASTTTHPHPSDRAQRRAAQREAEFRQQAEAAAQLESLPVTNRHAAGIDVGDRSHWVCVEATPDGSFQLALRRGRHQYLGARTRARPA